MTVEYILESWRYRELVYFFAWRDVKVRYKQAALGIAWAILQPLLSMIVFTLFFGRLAGIPSDGIPYPLFAYLGFVAWTYFSAVLVHAGQSLTSNANLITKVYFPRATLPFSAAASGLIDFAVGLSFLAVLMAYYQVPLGWPLLLAPIFVFGLIFFTVGMSLLLAALNVSYRDVKYVLPLLIQLWLFVTPVIYPTSFIPERFRPLMALNPLAGIIEGLRTCVLLGQSPEPVGVAISLTNTVIVFIVGLIYFRTTERSFADIV